MKINKVISVGCTLILTFVGFASAQEIGSGNQLSKIITDIESRSISFENVTGEKGKGGRAASRLGPGRKGAPNRTIAPGETVTLCDIKGAGVIRHIWATTRLAGMSGLVIRGYWDGQEHPSIEAPFGYFFGMAHGLLSEGAYESAVHSINPTGGMNIWIPMPFSKRAYFTITNETDKGLILFYNIDYTISRKADRNDGRLHVAFRRENPTTMTKDLELLPFRTGEGRFLGCVVGVRPLSKGWWGEGEFKAYVDGDREFPTIVGTGTEDYFGQAWGTQNKAYRYGGAYETPDKSLSFFYRWHILDPIYWKKDARITMQQIGLRPKSELIERADDWSVASFWYQHIPSAPLPVMPSYSERIKDYKQQ